MPDGADFVRGSTVILEDGTEHRTTLDAEAYDAMSAAGNELDWFGKVPGLDEAKIEILLMSGKSLIDMRDAIDSGRAKTMIDLYDLAGEMAIEKCAGRQALYSMQQALAAVFFEAHSRKAEYITEELLQNAAKWLGAMNEAEYATSPVAELEMYIKDDRMPLFEPPPSPGHPDLAAFLNKTRDDTPACASRHRQPATTAEREPIRVAGEGWPAQGPGRAPFVSSLLRRTCITRLPLAAS